MHSTWQVLDKRYPWIEYAVADGSYLARDGRTGEIARVGDYAGLMRWAAAHTAAPGHGGLGDVLRGLTKRLGFGECAPCAKRQASLNAMVPRVFRR